MIIQVAVRGFDRNFSYFIVSGREAFVVDPSDVPRLLEVVEEEGLVLKGILVTHGHFDHVAGVEELVERFGVPVYRKENLRDGEELVVGGVRVRVIYTPGHCDDAVCFLVEGGELSSSTSLSENFDPHVPTSTLRSKFSSGLVSNDNSPPSLFKAILTGDTLFVEHVGRADFANSNIEDFWRSLGKICALGDEVVVFPGHDYGSKPSSTIGYEKAHNRYLLCADFEEFKRLRL